MSNILNPVELTSALIKCRSITPTSAGSIDLIISYLEPMGLPAQNWTLDRVMKRLKIYMQDLVP